MAFIDPDSPLAAEILLESASSYFTACKKMVRTLDALKAFDLAAAGKNLSAAKARHREELLDDAAERVYFVIVQREAMQLSHDDYFLDRYEVPAEVRSRIGPGKK